jgi:transcriptional regulator NrdR family protein
MRVLHRIGLMVMVALLTTAGLVAPAQAAKKQPLTPDEIQAIVTQFEEEINTVVAEVSAFSLEFQQELNEAALDLLQGGQPDPAKIQKFATQIQKSVLKQQKTFVKSVQKLNKSVLKKLKREDLEPEVMERIDAAAALATDSAAAIAEQIQAQLAQAFGSLPNLP